MEIGSKRNIRYYANHKWHRGEVPELLEYPVAMSVNAKPWLTFLCFPDELENLAIGFLFNEGLINKASEVASVHVSVDYSHIDVWLDHAVKKPKRWSRTSGCSGGVTFGQNSAKPREDTTSFCIHPEQVDLIMRELFAWQSSTKSVHGLHCSALSNGKTILYASRDIGRHNTLDKLAGQVLLDAKKQPPLIALTTGRISSEMLLKCYRIGTAMVISRTSPSNLAVKLAEDLGITIIGNVRDSSFSVYSHPEVITGECDQYPGFLERDLHSPFPQPFSYPQVY
jgi:FdhD protein